MQHLYSICMPLRMFVCLGSVCGSDVTGVCRPLVLSRGPRTRSSAKYQTLPSQHHRYTDQRVTAQHLNPASTQCADQLRLVTGNSYGGRPEANGGNCERRHELLYAVSDVDLASYVDSCESTAARKHNLHSTTDLSSTASGLGQRTAMSEDLLHVALSFEELPDTCL